MNDLWTSAGGWMLRTGFGGGLVLLATCVLMGWTREPGRRQRLGEWGLVAALAVTLYSGLGQSWLVIAWTRAETAAEPKELHIQAAAVKYTLTNVPSNKVDEPAAALEDRETLRTDPRPAAVSSGKSPSWTEQTGTGAMLVCAGAAGFFTLRLLLGYAALLRLLWCSDMAPPEVRGLFETMAAGTRWVRLLVPRRLLAPISFGLVRPTVMLPAQMCERPAPRQLRWIFAHELTHVRRRDAWSSLLFNLGQVFFFALPWFWWMRRQVGLCQEYMADAAAAAVDEGNVEYAEFLVSLANAPSVPVGASAVSGHGSDLARRVTMVLNNPVRTETPCPRLWTLLVTGGLASLAILASCFSYRAEAADDRMVIVLRPRGASVGKLSSEQREAEKKEVVSEHALAMPKSTGDDIEEFLYGVLKREHRINYPRLGYMMQVQRVEGRKMIDALFVHLDPKTQTADVIARADEAEMRVDLPHNQLVFIMTRCAVWSTRDDANAYFESKEWPVELPPAFDNSGKEPQTDYNDGIDFSIRPNGDTFIIGHKQGAPMISVNGVFKGGKVYVGTIVVKDGEAEQTHSNLLAVPESHRARAELLQRALIRKVDGSVVDKCIEEFLRKRTVTLSFDNVPLLRCLHNIKDLADVHIVYNDEALLAAGLRVDKRVTLNVSNVKLESALNQLLQKAGLTYVITNQSILITAPGAQPETANGPAVSGAVLDEQAQVGAGNRREAQFFTDYQEARQEAKRTGLPIMIYCMADNCSWCKRIEIETFSLPAMAKCLNEKFVRLKVNALQQSRLISQLNVRAFPTIIFASPDGRILLSIEGFQNPYEFHENLQRVLGPVSKGERDWLPEWKPK